MVYLQDDIDFRGIEAPLSLGVENNTIIEIFQSISMVHSFKS